MLQGSLDPRDQAKAKPQPRLGTLLAADAPTMCEDLTGAQYHDQPLKFA